MAWRRTITWTNAYTIHWRIYAVLGGDELVNIAANLLMVDIATSGI